MWIILFNALDDFGIREVNDHVRAGSPPDAVPNVQFESLKRKVAEEALHGALRIAGLVSDGLRLMYMFLIHQSPKAGVLSSNNYLVCLSHHWILIIVLNGKQRLDPAVMHFSCIQAGLFLARLGRPEVSNCVSALEQYGAAYEETGEQAKEISRTYAITRSREYDFNHMASVAPRVVPTENNAMNVDSSSNMHDLNSMVSIQLSFHVGRSTSILIVGSDWTARIIRSFFSPGLWEITEPCNMS